MKGFDVRAAERPCGGCSRWTWSLDSGLMKSIPRNQVALIGLLAIAALVLTSVFFAPDRSQAAAERYTLIGLLVVSGAAQWRGTRTGLVVAFAVFMVLGALRGIAPYQMPYGARLDFFFDLGLFLAVAVVQGLATGGLARRERIAQDNERRMAAVNRLSAALMPSAPDANLPSLLVGMQDELAIDRVVLLLQDSSGQLGFASPSDGEWMARHPDAMAFATGVAARCASVAPLSEYCMSSEAVATPRALDLGAPLVSGGEFYGVLYARQERRRGERGASEATLLELASHVLAAFLARKQLEMDVADARATEASNRLKASLVSSVSHELKTPLAAATATVSGLLEEVLPEPVRTELSAARSDLELLNSQIADLLDIALLETSTWQPAFDWNDLHDVFSSLMSGLAAADRGRVHLEVPTELPMVRIDVVQLTRAMRHILENALAYSPPEAPVTIGASSEGGRVRIWVQDCGPGVAPSERERLFDKFYRGEASRFAPHGTGLGLTIAAEIARFHGGSIRIEDVEPHGARFVVELPAEPGGADDAR